MKSSLLCLLATTTTVVHGDTGCAEADKSCGVCLVKGDYTPDEVYTSAENNGGTALTCKAAVNGGKFTNKAQCTGVHPDRGPTTWSAWTNAFAQKCCSCKFIHDDSVVCVFPFFRSRSFHREEERLTT